MSSTDRDVDHALAYPEPPASPLWHRHGRVQARPLTDAEKKRNRELLVLAQHPAPLALPRSWRRLPNREVKVGIRPEHRPSSCVVMASFLVEGRE
ncbi:hypothetical protein, partial [Streptomyces sp. NRRL S-378]|uniref:hypothetical protein n=1 Tax=Streptomyces sp. NRRL S-378 TaxID=1463904 RepID=UPI0005688971